MPKSYFMMEVNAASESWRTIRSLRADPSPNLKRNLRGERGTVFHMALEQAQQQFAAAASIGYESRPLNLFYGLAQAGRAIAAASPRLDQNSALQNSRVWKASGHGLKFPPALGPQGFLNSSVKIRTGDTDLFSRVSLALGSTTDDIDVCLGAVLSQLPEISLEFGSIGHWLPNLHPMAVHSSWRGDPQLPIAWDLRLPGLPLEGDRDLVAVQQAVRRYPALRALDVALDDSEQVLRTHNDGEIRLLIRSIDLLEKRSDGQYFPLGTTRYRRHDVLLPEIRNGGHTLEPLMMWWTALFALSMLARYSPSDWTKTLAISSSPIASVVEHFLDSAIDAVPDLLSEALTNLD